MRAIGFEGWHIRNWASKMLKSMNIKKADREKKAVEENNAILFLIGADK